MEGTKRQALWKHSNTESAYGVVMRVAGYVRVSTEEQVKEGLSMESQERRIRSYCAAQEEVWEVVIYDDPGHTGLDTDRPGYQAMLANSGRWDAVLAIKGDRLHRSIDNARDFIRDMVRLKKQVWTIAEGRIDEHKNAGAWLTSMLTTQLLPEHESRQISERVLPGMETAKEKGLHQGRPPVGFIWVKALKKFQPTDWALEVRDDARRVGLSEAARLHTWPKGKRAGKPLNRVTVWRIVRNLKLYDDKKLLPNRRKTASGTYSKFKVK